VPVEDPRQACGECSATKQDGPVLDDPPPARGPDDLSGHEAAREHETDGGHGVDEEGPASSCSCRSATTTATIALVVSSRPTRAAVTERSA
jgi:hypothetical protein